VASDMSMRDADPQWPQRGSVHAVPASNLLNARHAEFLLAALEREARGHQPAIITPSYLQSTLVKSGEPPGSNAAVGNTFAYYQRLMHDIRDAIAAELRELSDRTRQTGAG